MKRYYRSSLRLVGVLLVYLAMAGILLPPHLLGAVATLKSGVRLEGRMGLIRSLGENPFKVSGAPGVDLKQIILLDDGLRRTFFPSKTLRSHAVTPNSHIRFKVPQRVASGRRTVGRVGTIVQITAFDEWGRRTFTMRSPKGNLSIVQGITEVTPLYCRVEGLMGNNPHVWDMRIATSSIPRTTLSKILRRHLKPKDVDSRRDIVKLYIQASRYQDARREIEEILKDFPDLKGLDKQLNELRQAGARRLIKEIELRRDAGQHGLAYSMLQRFPSEGIAGESLIQVRELIGEYEKQNKQREKVFQLIEAHLGKITDEKVREKIKPIQAEIVADLNVNTLNRMADYLRLSDDEKLNPGQKISLAISGWLLGSGAGTENLAVSLSLFEVRNLVREYLQSKNAGEREKIWEKLEALEGSSPKYVAALVANMKPTLKTEEQEGEVPGMFELTTPGLSGEPDITYYVQLPLNYDPYRRYPCVVTLHGAGSTPQQQIEWWAGTYSKKAKFRLGQASRHGYIVIAPKWGETNQGKYEYTAREHAAVLYSLLDACKRFAVDTDRVFLSGHSMGGDAAWDIGLAHPDLWAGVLPIVAKADKYVSHYWKNAVGLPLYFVSGEYDSDKISQNKKDWNRYLKMINYDVVLVEYKGRGHEHFHDEIQRIFHWMEHQKRKHMQSHFFSVSMRKWDNFFWWAELSDFPEKPMVAPKSWPKPGSRAAETEGRILENNGVRLSSAAAKMTIWLSPEMVDFSKKMTINGKTMNIQPNAKVLLEDVRTRCDRQHPFWSKLEFSKGRLR